RRTETAARTLDQSNLSFNSQLHRRFSFGRLRSGGLAPHETPRILGAVRASQQTIYSSFMHQF
ncbi:MAG: hypothetical protein ABI156_06555, partial [Caldimonas sp.]